MIEIIPAIDIIDGKCVRLTRGDYAEKKIYSSDPVAIAMGFEAIGVRRLHLVDLDGARAGRVKNHEVLAAIAGGTNLTIDFGGGVRSDGDMDIAFENGASMVTAGSLAVTRPDIVSDWFAKYSGDRIILGADTLDGRVAIHAWQDANGPDLTAFLTDYAKKGVKTVIATDVARDGVMRGPAFDLYRGIKAAFPDIYLIASGGVSSIEDVSRLDSMGIDGVIIGKAIYEGKIGLDELEGFLC